MGDLSVVIVNYNTRKLTLNCLHSLYQHEGKVKFETWVVDNASSDDSIIQIKKKFPKVHIIKSEKNLGFAGGNNLALREIDSKYALLLNSDTEIMPEAIDNLVDFMERWKVGIGSCRLVDGDNKFQPNAGDLPSGMALIFWLLGIDDILSALRKKIPSFHQKFSDYYKEERIVGWVSGAVMIIRRDVLDKIGKLDEKIFMYGEDTEYCLRANSAGFKVGWTDCAQIKHYGGGSLQNAFLNQWIGEFKGLLYIYKKYYGVIVEFGLRVLIYIAVLLRLLAFSILGKLSISRTYVKVLVSI